MSTNVVTLADMDDLDELRKQAVDIGHPAVGDYIERGVRQIMEFATLSRARRLHMAAQLREGPVGDDTAEGAL